MKNLDNQQDYDFLERRNKIPREEEEEERREPSETVEIEDRANEVSETRRRPSRRAEEDERNHPRGHKLPCADSICRDTLATPVDSFLFASTFVPLSVPTSKKPHVKQPTKDVPAKPGFHSNVTPIILNEIENYVTVPTLEEFKNSIKIDYDKGTLGSEKYAKKVESIAEYELESVYETVVKQAQEQFLSMQSDDGESLITAPNSAEQLRRLGRRFCSTNNVFQSGYLEKSYVQRESKTPLTRINNLGLLFLERLRIRPIGHTVERAPIYALSLQPGEIVTLRQKSFSKRSVSFEEASEEVEERRLEYSSTFTTELSEEFSHSMEESSNWGVSASVKGTYGSTEEGGVTGELGGNYGASSSESESSTEAWKRAREVSRKVETSQKTSHKTTISIATEDVLEEESIKVIRNEDTRAKKIFMRKLMRVIHLSYERYGVRFCWAPCVKEPGFNVRSLIPGPDAFPEELEAIRDKWANATPPSDVAGEIPPPPSARSSWTEKLSGGLFGNSDDWSHNIQIPEGYEFVNAFLEKKEVDGSPNVKIFRPGWSCPHGKTKAFPAVGSTGVAKIWVHWGLSGGIDAENVKYRVSLLLRPGANLTNQQQAVIDRWRQEQADKEIQEFLDTKREELKGLDPNAWPNSELMRRVIAENFGPSQNYDSCHMVSLLHKIFEWENLSYDLHAPWWNKNTPVNGLQALRTTFLNASWAKVYIPIRPGFEEEAITYLLTVGAIPNNPEWIDDLEYFLQDMHLNVEPLFNKVYEPSANEAVEIDGPCDILLTKLGTPEWDNKFESGMRFKVLDRFTVTIPTDGVDYEEEFARCDAITPSIRAVERKSSAEADLDEIVTKRVKDGEGDIKIERTN